MNPLFYILKSLAFLQRCWVSAEERTQGLYSHMYHVHNEVYRRFPSMSRRRITMNRPTTTLACTLALLVGGLAGCNVWEDAPWSGQEDSVTQAQGRGPYLGQKSPGSKAVLFAPGIVSTAAYELNSAFTPDGKEMYQTLVVEGWGFSAIIQRCEGSKGWNDPVVASFSGRYNDIDPNLSPDGNQIIFASRRPEDPAATKELSRSWDLWIASRKDAHSPWGKAQRLPSPVNTPAVEIYPSLSASGTIYFGSNREGGHGKSDIYRAKPGETGYGQVENLGTQINSEHQEGDAFIAPDESYIIVTVDGRPDSRGQSDLYISFAQEDGEWGKLHHMGGSINTSAKEYCPVVTPDGQFFFFTRGKKMGSRLHSDQQKTYKELAEKIYTWRNNLENVYWMNEAVLKREVYE